MPGGLKMTRIGIGQEAGEHQEVEFPEAQDLSHKRLRLASRKSTGCPWLCQHRKERKRRKNRGQR